MHVGDATIIKYMVTDLLFRRRLNFVLNYKCPFLITIFK